LATKILELVGELSEPGLDVVGHGRRGLRPRGLKGYGRFALVPSE
jgi:hypothetical protein